MAYAADVTLAWSTTPALAAAAPLPPPPRSPLRSPRPTAAYSPLRRSGAGAATTTTSPPSPPALALPTSAASGGDELAEELTRLLLGGAVSAPSTGGAGQGTTTAAGVDGVSSLLGDGRAPPLRQLHPQPRLPQPQPPTHQPQQPATAAAAATEGLIVEQHTGALLAAASHEAAAADGGRGDGATIVVVGGGDVERRPSSHTSPPRDPAGGGGDGGIIAAAGIITSSTTFVNNGSNTQQRQHQGPPSAVATPILVVNDTDDAPDAPLLSSRRGAAPAAAAAASITCRNTNGSHGRNNNSSAAAAWPPLERSEWPGEAAARLLYVAVFLEPASREVLLGLVPPAHARASADHMTLCYKPSVPQLLTYPLGARVTLRLTGSVRDARAQAVAADPPHWLPESTSATTHVTVSVAPGVPAVEAGRLLERALTLDDGGGGDGNGDGAAPAYLHFDEPLPLVGRVGVRLAPPPGRPSCDGEIVYDLAQLAARGLLTLPGDVVGAFFARHADALAGREPSAPAPAPALPLGAGAAAGTVANLTSNAPPATSAGSSSGVGSNCPPPVVQFLDDVAVGDYVAVRPFVPAAAAMHDHNGGGGNDGSSSSTSGGGALVRGRVAELASDERFQAAGVLVVLADRTVGYVAAVLERDSDGADGGHGRGRGAAGANASPTAASGSPTAASGWHQVLGVAPAAAPAPAPATTNDGSDGGVAGERGAVAALWREWEALQRAHGEALCAAILADCDGDIAAAVALVKAQQQQQQQQQAPPEQAAAAAAASPDGTTTTATATTTPSNNNSGDAAAAADRLLLVRGLARSAGLDAAAAERLAGLAPAAPAERVVHLLQQHKGDAAAAADALLSGGDGGGGGAAPAAGSLATAAAGAAEATRPARALVAASDPATVVAARRLAAAFPPLSLDAAVALLQAHGGDAEAAARALAEAGGASAFTMTTAPAATAPARAPAAAAAVCSAPLATEPPPPLSEARQLTMLREMGLLQDNDDEGFGASPARNNGAAAGFALATPGPVPQPAVGTPPRAPLMHSGYFDAAPSPPPSPPAAQPRAAPPAPASPARRASGGRGPQHGGGGSRTNSGRRRGSRSASPPSPTGSAAGSAAAAGAVERARLQAEVDKLHTQAEVQSEAALVYQTAAAACRAAGDIAGCRSAEASSREANAAAKALRERASRLANIAHNFNPQGWTLDLHGQTAAAARDTLTSMLQGLVATGFAGGVELRVVVGQGHHSPDNVPRVKLAVMDFLEERDRSGEDGGRVVWQIDAANPGVIVVHILPPHVAAAIAGGDGDDL